MALPMVWLILFPSAFFFRGGDLTFRISGVDYKAFLKNFPFLKRLRVWLTGIRSASLFSFSGLTFVQTGVIVWHSFCGKPACGARGGRWSLMGSPVFFCRTCNSFTLSSRILRRFSEKFPNSQGVSRDRVYMGKICFSRDGMGIWELFERERIF